nr:prolyl oligopeptidase family serine peptidase [Bifidobacterium dolichotidis]
MSFRNGAPRTPQLLGDGSRMLFLRSDGPENTQTSLWMSVLGAGASSAVTAADSASNSCSSVNVELLLADPSALQPENAEVPAEELARRERARERATGIVSYATDTAGQHVVFSLDGQLFVANIPTTEEALSLAAKHDPKATQAVVNAHAVDVRLEQGTQADAQPVLNARLSPDGQRVAYTTGSAIVVVDLTAGASHAESNDTNAAIVLQVPADRRETVTIGLAEFAAAEEMDRYEGFWWAPDSRTLLVERADSSAEPIWNICDPANPSAEPDSRRYPRALTKNAAVALLLVRLDERSPRSIGTAQVHWDVDQYEYLARVLWPGLHRPLLLVQDRLQRNDQVLEVHIPAVEEWNDFSANLVSTSDFAEVETTAVEQHHNDQWIDIIDGTPALTPNGHLICALNDMQADTNRLTIDGKPFTPQGWQVRSVLSVSNTDVMAVVQRTPELAAEVPEAWAEDTDWYDARSYDVVTISLDGHVEAVSEVPGVWSAQRRGKGLVLWGTSMASPQVHMTHMLHTEESTEQQTIRNNAATPGFEPNVRFVQLGERKLFTAITLPSKSSEYAGAAKLPVLMKPYGGPGFQEVALSQRYYWDSQWWADQGWIVVTSDGRGTTGRGPRWDRAIYENMKQVTLDDQVDAVHALKDALVAMGEQRHEQLPEPDLENVSMIGWSYGGFLSATAVLEAPDVFRSACAGAPPVDWTLYDTHYTERYLGLDPDVYERNSVIASAANLQGHLMLIHGFADDNVAVANSLRLSHALMAAGKDHTFLPLVGITHMTNDPEVAKNLLILQRDFLRKAGTDGNCAAQ